MQSFIFLFIILDNMYVMGCSVMSNLLRYPVHFGMYEMYIACKGTYIDLTVVLGLL